MRSTLVTSLGLAVLAFGARDVSAQTSSSASGTWVFEQMVRTAENPTPVRSEAVLVIREQGDSLVGEWTLAVPGREAVPTKLTGRQQGDRVRLRSNTDLAMLRSQSGGSSMSVEYVSEYTLQVKGDSIRGSVERHVLDGSVEIPPTPLEGKRKQ